MERISLFTHNEEKIEHCGVVGVYSKKGKSVAPILYKAMLALQHRGQDAAGFAIWNGKELVERKGMGLVNEIFKDDDLRLEGKVGVAHTRYPTTGLCLISDVQPFKKSNIAVSHNGQISNYLKVRTSLENQGISFVSTVDSEIVVHFLLEKLKKGLTINESIKEFMEISDGSYGISAIVEGELIAFRDPHGIKPLVWGENEDFIIFASESVALDVNQIKLMGDVQPGELVLVKNNVITRAILVKNTYATCMFEYVYFARPDSIIDGKCVMDVRKRLGAELAKEHPVDADIVIDVPDSARSAAAEYAKTLGIEYSEGLIKNRYVGRTFIMPNQEKRAASVRVKLNPVHSVVFGKRVVIVDDSIVRGTTLREIINLIRTAGATEVHVRITCPPIRAPCFYGIDMSTYKELLAHGKSVNEIKEFLRADSVGYLSIGKMKQAIGIPVCTGCLNEEYPTQYAKKLADELKTR
ncbi:amidophosphoribosyltransferase [Candidatus Micrarchaeota archaeon]|nr:amidophosphoribosyltransferase [Candidatus Micrarchaeota archaeon]